MVAHRGVSGIELENTLPAFVAAGNRSYYGIETDVHRTKDGKFVVFHDDSTKRVAGGVDFVIEETDFDTLRNLQLVDRDGDNTRIDLRIPTLREYSKTCKHYNKKSILELKNAFVKDDIEKIIEIIRAEGQLENTVFISFCFENLVFIRDFLPEQPVQFLFGEYTNELIEKVKAHGFGIDVEYHQLTRERIEYCHRLGIDINCWTCDDLEQATRLMNYGVDYITSNIIE